MDKMVFMMFADEKTLNWGRSAQALRVGRIEGSDRNPILFPIDALNQVIRLPKRRLAFCFRYLNDYPSRSLTLLRLISEIGTILIAKIFKTKIFWIIHNVDKETSEFHPKISKLRRKLVQLSSDKIFVTSHDLCDFAATELGVDPRSLDIACFGPHLEEEAYKTKEISTLKYWYKQQKRDSSYVGLWIGSLTQKKVDGLEQIDQWVKAGETNTDKISFIIVGPSKDELERVSPALYDSIVNSDRVFFYEGKLQIPYTDWPEICDFIFKPLNDLSIPLTLYNAASARVPYVAFEGTFLGDLISRFRLGASVEFMCSATDLIHDLNHIRFDFTTFISANGWDRGSTNLLKHI